MTKRSPAQKLARQIQSATGKQYTVCLEEARAILAAGSEGTGKCGDAYAGRTCVLKPGPHPDWRHQDETGARWGQHQVFPYGNGTGLRPRGPSADRCILDEITEKGEVT